MRFAFKKFLVVASIALFAVAPILCCCIQSLAHAAPVMQHSSSHCHSDQKGQTSKSDSCHCIKAQIVPEKQVSTVVDANALLLLSSQSMIAFLPVALNLDSVQRSEHSPPELYSSPQPLYIKNSNLRI